MRLYLDTSIANDTYVLLQANAGSSLYVKDVKANLRKMIREYIALYYLLDLSDQWALEFGSSPVMKEEILKIKGKSMHAQNKRSALLDIYTALLENTTFTELRPIPTDLFNQVRTSLPHQKDVEHICQAILGDWDFFITTDFKSILNEPEATGPYRKRRSIHGMTAISPSQFMEDNFMTLELLVRTLHGSWTTLEEVVDSWVNSIQGSIQEL